MGGSVPWVTRGTAQAFAAGRTLGGAPSWRPQLVPRITPPVQCHWERFDSTAWTCCFFGADGPAPCAERGQRPGPVARVQVAPRDLCLALVLGVSR